MRLTETKRADTDQNERDRNNRERVGPQQKTLGLNPIEFSPEERARFLREVAAWTREEEAEDFHQLPGESLSEFLRARDAHLDSFDTFGPLFPGSRSPVKRG